MNDSKEKIFVELQEISNSVKNLLERLILLKKLILDMDVSNDENMYSMGCNASVSICPNSEVHELWEKAKEVIKKNTTDISFNTWINTIVPMAISNDEIILAVPSDFNKKLLETRYYSYICEVIHQISSKLYKISIILNE
jgi:hypothetical protein